MTAAAAETSTEFGLASNSRAHARAFGNMRQSADAGRIRDGF